MIARVVRAERIGQLPFGRVSFEFDAIDAEVGAGDLLRVIDDEGTLWPFAAVRVVTTEAAFDRIFGFIPVEGAWVELALRPRGEEPGPIAFHSQLAEDGYARHSRGVLDEARLLLLPDDEPKFPTELSASVPAVTQTAATLINVCNFPVAAKASRRSVQALLNRIGAVDRIQVRDVGQASFVSLLSSEGKCVAHFDAGWPISFNGHTTPKVLPHLADGSPVVLSHWDWDHLHAYYKCPKLRTTKWLTPVQELGPGARKVAQQLHKAGLLLGYKGSSVTAGKITLLRCVGPSKMNDNGLALDLYLRTGKRALLVGDASYVSARHRLRLHSFDYLVVTHHGADFAGAVPRARGDARGVVSVGRGNVYKHPRRSALRKHVGWTLEMTSGHRRRRRGDRLLGP